MPLRAFVADFAAAWNQGIDSYTLHRVDSCGDGIWYDESILASTRIIERVEEVC